MVECGGCEAEGASGLKGLLDPVDGLSRVMYDRLRLE